MSYTITDACIGCTQCAKNCPAAAITGSLKELHTVDPGRCIDCGLCAKLCPKNAILDEKGQATSKLARSEWKKPVVREDICAGCSICVVDCPKNCLEIEGPKFHGDINTVVRLVRAEDCIGCGICADSCPIEAIVLP